MGLRGVDVVVGPDGGVDPQELARLGVRPGDRFRVVPVGPRTRRSLLGAFPREIGFTQEHLDDIRQEMAENLGDDLI